MIIARRLLGPAMTLPLRRASRFPPKVPVDDIVALPHPSSPIEGDPAAVQQTKPPVPKKRKEQPPVDESRWRASTVPEDRKLTKTQVKKKYLLNASDLELLKNYPNAITVFYNKKDRVKVVFQYSEREAERAAWKKRGGPESFEAHLVKLRARKNSIRPLDEEESV
ncbi:hypothetical protein C8R43DRAFT_1031525 [Mycena crocata]|nr:hypothetical protein C8R43DRAFT_1031525 [Mycena crocata]